VLRDTTEDWEPDGLPARAAQQVRDALIALRAQLTGGELAVERYAAPPFSRGTCHWWGGLEGELRAVVYYPYRGRRRDRAEMAAFLHKMAESLGPAGGRDSAVPCQAVADAERAKWDPYREQWCAIWTPRPVGDIWVLRAKQFSDPHPCPLHAITAPVTFELWADITPPNGVPDRVGGYGTAEWTEAWTTPEPPRPTWPGLHFPPDGPDRGRCTVELAKGWKWKASARPRATGYSTGELRPLNVAGAAARRLDIQLEKLLTFRAGVVTDATPAVAQPAEVELELQVQGGLWAQVNAGPTTEQPNGDCVRVAYRPLAPGTYRVRAKRLNAAAREWSEWEVFEVMPGIELTKTIAVPMGEAGR